MFFLRLEHLVELIEALSQKFTSNKQFDLVKVSLDACTPTSKDCVSGEDELVQLESDKSTSALTGLGSLFC